MSPGACLFQPGYYGDGDVPLLILHGTSDLFVEFESHAVATLERVVPLLFYWPI